MTRTAIAIIAGMITLQGMCWWAGAEEMPAIDKKERVEAWSNSNKALLSDFDEEGFCEQELPKTIREQYRILWTRAFHPPIFVTLTIDAKGQVFSTAVSLDRDPRECDVTKKQTTWVDVCEYEARKYDEETDEYCSDLREAITDRAERAFWKLPIDEDAGLIVLDGSTWAVEGRRGKDCHVVIRSSPGINTEFFHFVWFALQAADRQLYFDEVY